MTEESEICKFYNGQNVFITGGTGFMGKILMEKLLRSTDVSNIFLLVREKKGKNVHARLDDIFDNIIFDKLKTERPKFRHRVVAVAGDCSFPGLGLTITDRQKLLSEVNIVFHVAATVRFDENLKLAYSINVNGTGGILELCRQMKGLKALVHVSTAYANCHLQEINEKFYDCPVDYEKLGALLEKMSKNEAEKLTPRIIGKWPNTYTFTKALAESLIQKTGGGLPVGVFRPSIVLSTNKEPIESWTDNLYGPAGAAAGAASGLVRVLPCVEEAIADVVPVDTCVAGLIASAWDITKKTNEHSSNIPVYNYVSSVENPLTWGEYNALNKIHGCEYPLQKALWTIKVDSIEYRPLYLLLRVLLHLLPALLLDGVAVVIGQKPRLITLYKKIHKFSDVTEFFSTREWKFTSDNVIGLWEQMNKTDRILFPVSITTVHWTNYYKGYFKGIRVYQLKDPLSTLDEARTRKRNFDILRVFIIGVGIFLFVTFIWIVILKVLTLFIASGDSCSNNGSNEYFTNFNV